MTRTTGPSRRYGLALLLIGAMACTPAGPLRLDSIDTEPTLKAPVPRHELPSIAVRPFEDATGVATPGRIGTAYVGARNEAVEIRSERTGAEHVHRAIVGAVEQLGFSRAEPNAAEYVIDGVVRTFWVDEQNIDRMVEYSRALVRYDLFFSNAAGDVVWTVTVDGHWLSRMTAMDTTATVTATLTGALASTLPTVFDDPAMWTSIGSPAAPEQAR